MQSTGRLFKLRSYPSHSFAIMSMFASSLSPNALAPTHSTQDRQKQEADPPHSTLGSPKAWGKRRAIWALTVIPLAMITVSLSALFLDAVPAVILPAGRDSIRYLYSRPIRIRSLHNRANVKHDSGQHAISHSISFASIPTSFGTSPSPSSTETGALPTMTSVPKIPTSPPRLPSPFPQPFDVSIQQNFSSTSCQNFFASMLIDSNFRTCRPFALLLVYSQALIDAQSNSTLLNSIVWGTCNTSIDQDTCTSNMSNFAKVLRSSCSAELAAQNSIIVTTLQGLLSYGPLRNGGCLADQATSSYCYIEAAASPSPSDLYFYQLPLGFSLPNNTKLSCSPCTKSLMAIYASTLQGSNSAQLTLLAKTYNAAAQSAQQYCGSMYATTATSRAGPSLGFSSMAVCLALILTGFTLLT